MSSARVEPEKEKERVHVHLHEKREPSVVPPVGAGPLRGKRLVFIEGNIGGGKSTLLEALKRAWDTRKGKYYHDGHGVRVAIVPEPLDEWMTLSMTMKPDGRNVSIFELFNSDPERWASTFQFVTFRTRIRALLGAAKNADIVVMERSVFSDRYGFATNVHQVGLMNDLEWKHYLEEYKWFMTEMLQLNESECHFVYLATSPEEAADRIKKRARVGELAATGLSRGYLEALHARHEEWLGGSSATTVSGAEVTQINSSIYTLETVDTLAAHLVDLIIVPTVEAAIDIYSTPASSSTLS